MWLETTKKFPKDASDFKKHLFSLSQLKQKTISIINWTKGDIFRNKENVVSAQKQKLQP